MPRKPVESIESDAALPTDPKASSLFVGSTEKAFQVLHAFDGPHKQMPLSDIAKAAGLDRSAAQRLVYTLETLGYIRRVHKTRNYALTSKVLQFAYNYLHAHEVLDKAAPYLLEISRSVGETTNLQELDGHEIVYVGRFPGQHLVNVDIMVGSRLPALFTASGTAILSRRSPEEIDEVFAKTDFRPLTPYTMTDKAKLRERIQEASEKGYAVVANETVMGDISIAAAITDEHGRAVAALNIAAPTTRWTVEKVEAELAHHVQVAATSSSMAKFVHYQR
ncbi:IclR family transcriptional regulator [Rhizobium sp. RM]|uniref:IclR family transcriptional regulator n=1 Tax=Rhizobium/Agrobacterium group TaxID=227290 RepID=UPI00110EF1B8|nr:MULTISPECIES: IclR family transcriptional regulator C-terminal domain-containing protein [Rhizobium/Agrobacterium group]NWJ27780.1 helix-turn-helix domain-containing protein [Rhizobium sp. RM]TMV21934.1 IclR family transcriptional regulator [Rhizobium sp. Td3]UXS03832.1 helix-turn-helix domain-containing protein [Agrobacterium tumefaciens]